MTAKSSDTRLLSAEIAESIEQPNEAPDLDSPEWYLNRELTWLEFNRRVLHEAADGETRSWNASSSSPS